VDDDLPVGCYKLQVSTLLLGSGINGEQQARLKHKTLVMIYQWDDDLISGCLASKYHEGNIARLASQ
jgi:hypothetical protein